MCQMKKLLALYVAGSKIWYSAPLITLNVKNKKCFL